MNKHVVNANDKDKDMIPTSILPFVFIIITHTMLLLKLEAVCMPSNDLDIKYTQCVPYIISMLAK